MNILFAGCSTGFGRSVCEALIMRGANVFGFGLNGPHYNIDFTKADLSLGPQAVLAAYRRRYSPDQPIDCLIWNAGLAKCNWVQDYSMTDWKDVLNVNLNWPFAMIRELVQHQFTTPGNTGHPLKIITTSSMGATIGLRGSPAYCAAKAGLEALTRTLSKEWAGVLPISIVTVAPGGVDNTEMQAQVEEDLCRMRGFTKDEARIYNRQSPLGRNMTHDELVDIYEFLVFKAPEYLTGSVIKCTGGMGI